MPSRKEILSSISAALALRSPLTAREIASLLAASGLPVDKSSINKCLYTERTTFRHSGDSPPFWSLVGMPSAGEGTPTAPAPLPEGAGWPKALDLYAWQRRALDGWASHGHRGVVEAVTGAGKTRLALAAIASEMTRGGKAVAIVPTTELQGQWHGEIRRRLIGGAGLRARVGLLGDGQRATLATCDILVATVQSACRYELDPPPTGALLIADEVHHYGAEAWSQAMEEGFDRRLGLTATYERDDGGVEAVLDPYFGAYRYRLGYREALDDAIILASSRSRRQMVQAMGRVVRKKPDGRMARLAVLFVEGTSEDPGNGAHEDFIGFVVDAADDHRVFGAGTVPGKVVAYLNDWG